MTIQDLLAEVDRLQNEYACSHDPILVYRIDLVYLLILSEHSKNSGLNH